MGCPWFVYWSLSDAWKGNTILVPTQTKCYWGGTGLAAMNSQYQIKWNDLMAASTVSSLPLVVLFICFQKYFIAGMTGGAVKS